jgi:hypothetical protein
MLNIRRISQATAIALALSILTPAAALAGKKPGEEAEGVEEVEGPQTPQRNRRRLRTSA